MKKWEKLQKLRTNKLSEEKTIIPKTYQNQFNKRRYKTFASRKQINIVSLCSEHDTDAMTN